MGRKLNIFLGLVAFGYAGLGLITQKRFEEERLPKVRWYEWPRLFFTEESVLDDPKHGSTQFSSGKDSFGFVQYHERSERPEIIDRLDNYFLILLGKQDKWWYKFKR